jgi:hypothetical protein
MSRSISRTQSWHLPFICLLSLFTALISLSHLMSSYAWANVVAQGIDMQEFKMHGLMVTSACFAIYLFATFKLSFEKVFIWSLKATFALVILSYLFLFHSKWGYVLFKNVFPELFLLLGWSYLNHVFNLNAARRSYFAILFFSMLFAIPLIYLPMMLGFGNKLMTDGVFGVMLLSYVLINVCLRWIKKDDIKSDNFVGKNLKLFMHAFILLALSFLLLSMKWSAESLLVSLKEQAKNMASDGTSYIEFIEKGYLKAGVLGLSIYAFAFYKGAYIVKKYGWLKAMYVTPLVAAVVFLVSGLFPDLNVMNLGFALINGFQGAFVFPLVLLVFLAFSNKYRFIALGLVILVIKPIMEFLFDGKKFYFASAFALSFGLIFVFMILSYYINKKVMTDNIEQIMRK